MMQSLKKIGVTSSAFSRNLTLRREIERIYSGVTYNETGKTLSEDELIGFLDGMDGVILGMEKITQSVLEKAPSLKWISKFGVGLDNIDFEACRRMEIEVTWKSGVNAYSVAEQTLGFMLMLSRNLMRQSMLLKSGCWEKNGGRELRGKTVGIVGLGNVGSALAQLLKPFSVNILGCDIIDRAEIAKALGVSMVSQDFLFRQSDIVSLHVPLTDQTYRMVNEELLRGMKPSAFLVNTSRGGVVCQDDLHKILEEGVILGAALDVFEEEPLLDSKFAQLPQLICTPHICGNSEEAVLAMGRSAIEGLRELSSV